MGLLLLLLPATPDGMTLPPKVWDGVTATLSVRVADQTPQPGTARVRLRLTAEGPADLVVKVPPPDDALAGWRVARSVRTSSLRPDGCRWECVLELEQVKPGVVPLPGVSILVESGGKSERIAWPDLLHESADVAPVAELPPPPPSPWPGRLRLALFLLLGLLGLTAVAFGVRRWAARPRPARSPMEAALSGLDGVGRDPGDPLHAVAELDRVLRVFLETRGIPATRSTGAELGGALRDVRGGAELTSILARGEELKFAGGRVRKEEVGELVERARRVVAGLASGEGQGV